MTQQGPGFRWGHININVRDLDRSIAFYRKLGFEVFIPAIPYLGLDRGAEAKPLPADAATALGVRQGTRGRACILQLDDGLPKLDLTEFVDLEPREPLDNGDRGIVRICLATEDLAGEVARLRSEGVFVQWIGLPFVDEALLATLGRSLLEVFPAVHLYLPGRGQGALFLATVDGDSVPDAVRSFERHRGVRKRRETVGDISPQPSEVRS